MSYSWLLIDRAFFVHWKKLSTAGLDKILGDLRNANKTLKQRIIYVSVTPAEHPVPTAVERNALSQFAVKAGEFCEVGHLVIEGDSIGHSIQRTAITGVMFLMQQKTVPNYIHKHLDQALRLVGPKINMKPEEILRTLGARGFFDEK